VNKVLILFVSVMYSRSVGNPPYASLHTEALMYSIETIAVDDELIDRCYATGTLHLDLGEQEYGVNSYVVLRSNIEDKKTVVMRYMGYGEWTKMKKILMAKPTAMVGRGKAFGPVPGTIEEKYAPYLASYEIVLKKIFGDRGASIFQRMKQKKDLEFIPVELARGCTFENCTFILDEAQNLDWHELNTIVSRMGEGTKMLILGDLYQITQLVADIDEFVRD